MPHEVQIEGQTLVVDDGQWEDLCHNAISAEDLRPICGNPNAIKCVKGEPRSSKPSRCMWCNRPICPACKKMGDVHRRTGIWP